MFYSNVLLLKIYFWLICLDSLTQAGVANKMRICFKDITSNILYLSYKVLKYVSQRKNIAIGNGIYRMHYFFGRQRRSMEVGVAIIYFLPPSNKIWGQPQKFSEYIILFYSPPHTPKKEDRRFYFISNLIL